MNSGPEDLTRLYQQRFPTRELQRKNAVWEVLCRDFFQRFVPAGATVVDVGAGYCEFINNVRADAKIAVDLNPDVRRFAAPGVRTIMEPSTAMRSLDANSVDVVFMSNFLEHLAGKNDVLETLREAARVLRPGGRIIVLQPNIRFVAGEYWDYFDHHVPLTDRSLVEGLVLAGFSPTTVFPRFLPYTMKGRLPATPLLVKIYVRLPLLWRFFGKQALVVAIKGATP